MAHEEYYVVNEIRRRISTLEQKLRILNDERHAQEVLLRQAVTLMEIVLRQHNVVMDRLNKKESE